MNIFQSYWDCLECNYIFLIVMLVYLSMFTIEHLDYQRTCKFLICMC